MNRLFTDGRWNAAHWIFVAFFVLLVIALTLIALQDPLAAPGISLIFMAFGGAWFALLSVAVVTLLRRTRDMHEAIRRFEAMTEASLRDHAGEPPPLRQDFAGEAAGRARVRAEH